MELPDTAHELEQIKLEAEKKLSELKQYRVAEARTQIEEVLRRHDLHLLQVIGDHLNLPKGWYVNPVNYREAWSGRGRRPLWVRSWISNHGTLENLPRT